MKVFILIFKKRFISVDNHGKAYKITLNRYTCVKRPYLSTPICPKDAKLISDLREMASKIGKLS